MSTTHELSRAAHDRLSEEHEQLTTVGRIEIADKIERARELGDLRENGDYHAAKDEQGKMEARIRQLAAILDNCVIIEHGEQVDAVRTGALVSLVYEGDDEIEQFLYGSIEERRDGVDNLSPTSPLGVALAGAKVGDTVSFTAPSGAAIAVKVVDIEA
jgi:transcription elongation factor GreA